MSTFTKQPFTGVVTRRNIARNPRQVSTGADTEQVQRWGWTRTFTTGISWAPYGITTACRRTTNDGVSRANPGTNFGGNVDGATIPLSGNNIAYPVTAGQSVKASSCMAWSWATTGTHFITARFYDAAGNAIGGLIDGAQAARLTEATWSGVAPAGAAYWCGGDYFNGSSPGAAGEWVEFTGIDIEVGTTGAFFDGSTPSSDVAHYAFEGTANSSPSTMTTPTPGTEQLSPTFGPTAPTEYRTAASNLVHRLLDDPSSTWVTVRKPTLRSGVWALLYDNGSNAAAAVLALSSGVWRFDSDTAAGGVNVSRFTVPEGQEVSMKQTDDLLLGSASDYVWEVTVPWQEVTA